MFKSYLKINNQKIKLFIVWTKREYIEYRTMFQYIVFYVPESMGFDLLELQRDMEANQETVLQKLKQTKNMKIVKRTRKELEAIINKYVHKYEKLMGVKAGRIRISYKPTKHEWAHCSGKKGFLSFSSDCEYLPEHIIEMLVAHELTHIKVYGHGKKFYQELEKYVPGAREKDKEINLYTDIPEEVIRYVEQEVQLQYNR